MMCDEDGTCRSSRRRLFRPLSMTHVLDARTLSCVLVLLRYRRLCIDAGRLPEEREKHMPELEQLESDAEQLEENRKRIEADKEAALSHAQETRKKYGALCPGGMFGRVLLTVQWKILCGVVEGAQTT